MVVLHDIHSGSQARPGLFARITEIVARVQQAHARRVIYRQTLRELEALSNRDLADLGLSRSMIRQVAREAAGK